MTDYLVPVLLLLSSALALGRKEDSYGLLLEGADRVYPDGGQAVAGQRVHAGE